MTRIRPSALGLMLASLTMGTSFGPSFDEPPTFVDRDAPPPAPEPAPGSNPERARKNAAKRSRKAQRARRGRR